MCRFALHTTQKAKAYKKSYDLPSPVIDAKAEDLESCFAGAFTIIQTQLVAQAVSWDLTPFVSISNWKAILC